MLQIQRNSFDWVPSLLDDMMFNDRPEYSRPSVNAIKGEKEYRLQFTAPGFAREEISVSVENGLLTVSMKSGKKEEDVKYLHREFRSRSSRQSFRIPEDADSGMISARLENGILEVVLPRREKPQENARQIEIC